MTLEVRSLRSVQVPARRATLPVPVPEANPPDSVIARPGPAVYMGIGALAGIGVSLALFSVLAPKAAVPAPLFGPPVVSAERVMRSAAVLPLPTQPQPAVAAAAPASVPATSEPPIEQGDMLPTVIVTAPGHVVRPDIADLMAGDQSRPLPPAPDNTAPGLRTKDLATAGLPPPLATGSKQTPQSIVLYQAVADTPAPGPASDAAAAPAKPVTAVKVTEPAPVKAIAAAVSEQKNMASPSAHSVAPAPTFAAATVLYRAGGAAQANVSPGPQATGGSRYTVLSVPSKDIVLIQSQVGGKSMVSPYKVGQSLPDGSVILAMDPGTGSVRTSGGTLQSPTM